MMINRFGGNLGTGSCEEVDKDRGRDTYSYAPPAQNRTCGFPASGSHLGCLTTRSFATGVSRTDEVTTIGDATPRSPVH